MAPHKGQQAAGTGSIDPARTRLIESARAGWISRLIDLSRRNNFLCYRPNPSSSIEVPGGSPALEDLLAGKMVTAQALLPDPQDRPARVLSIARKVQENSEEKGLQTLYLAVGFATWEASDGGRDPKAPIFLLPIVMKKKGRELTALEIQVAGEPKINPVLLHLLSDEFNIQLTEEELIEAVTPQEPEAGAAKEVNVAAVPGGYAAVIESLRHRFGNVPGFATELTSAIGNFSFAKLALVNDLKAAGDLLAANEVIAAIAGDTQARGRPGLLRSRLIPEASMRSLPSRSSVLWKRT